MSAFSGLLLHVRRGETPIARAAKSVVRAILYPKAPRLPEALKPALRVVYEAHFFAIATVRNLVTVFYRSPLFQARCVHTGKRLSMEGLPFVCGHTEISIGDDVYLGGKINIFSGRFNAHPKLVIQDRAQVAWNVTFVVNSEIVIEEDARISFDCRISDSDGHPRQADLRAKNAPLNPRDIRPVRIGRNAWIGNSSHIMKGVTIGEGAIVAANSVVLSDIPPYSLALGNPAEVYITNYGRPSRARRATAAAMNG